MMTITEIRIDRERFGPQGHLFPLVACPNAGAARHPSGMSSRKMTREHSQDRAPCKVCSFPPLHGVDFLPGSSRFLRKQSGEGRITPRTHDPTDTSPSGPMTSLRSVTT